MSGYGTLSILLLTCLLTGVCSRRCPAQCQCQFRPSLDRYICALRNSTGALVQISVVEEFIYLSVDCQGRNLSCFDVPQLHYPPKNIRLVVISCSSTEVLQCVYATIQEPEIYSLKVYVKNESLTTEDVRTLHSMRQVELNLTADTPIPVAAINTWSSLKHLYIWRENSQATNISNKNITTLGANTFIGLTSLISLYIIDNNIENINEDAFKGLNSLEKLNIVNDKIQFISVGTFRTPKLRSLIISGCRLKTLSNGVLHTLNQLEEIWLIRNKVRLSLDSETFSQLPALKFIDISNSKISELQETVFNSSSCMKILKINNNTIETLPVKIFWSLASLKQLYLSYNHLTELPQDVFKNLKQLQHLDLSYNNILTLPKTLFNELLNLTHLKLNGNQISSITWTIINNPRKIFLTYNWNDMVTSRRHDSPFKLLTQLRVLDLGRNQISKLYKQWHMHLRSLEVMNLTRNKFSDVEDVVNANFSNVNMTIDLSHNYIRYIHLPSQTLTDDDQSTTNVMLNGNPIECDCYNYGLYLRVKGNRQPGEPAFLLEDHRCISPPNLRGHLFRDISPELLTCDLTEQCPNTCRCIATINGVIVHCPYLPSQDDFEILTHLEQNLTLNLVYYPESIEGYNIHKLNVSNTGLFNITFRPVDTLKILDVRFNNLKTIPTEFLKANISIYLSNNPLDCQCLFVKDIASLYENGLVPDFSRITCSNGDSIRKINQSCNKEGISISGIGYSVFGALILVISVIKLMFNSKEVWMCILKVFCKSKYEEKLDEGLEMVLDADKEYDLFISFAHTDELFVAEKIIPKIQNEFGQKVCVLTQALVERDFITDQIIESVENSRRTMIVLTENFLMSEWSYLEFRTAYNLYLQDGRPRVIVVLLKEEVLRDARMCEELKLYISNNSYFLWGAFNFWAKLLKVLPKKPK